MAPSTAPIPLISSIPRALQRVSDGQAVGGSYLQQCVDSWFAAGFQPISVNAQRELKGGLVLPQTVHSVSTREDARKVVGRPLVMMHDILRAGCGATTSVFCIANADVTLEPSAQLLAQLRALPPGRALIARRLDIKTPHSRAGLVYPSGFDFVALHATDAARVPDFGMVFGAPWWDHWLPAALALMDVEVQVVHEPFVFHLWHGDRRDEEPWYRLGERYAAQMAQLAASTSPRSPAVRALRTTIERIVMSRDSMRSPSRRLLRLMGIRRREILYATLTPLSHAVNEHFDAQPPARLSG